VGEIPRVVGEVVRAVGIMGILIVRIVWSLILLSWNCLVNF